VTVPQLQRWAGLLAVLNFAMIAILMGRPYFSNASRPVRGISNPVLAMEVARNVTEVDAILSDAPSPDREAMRIKQYADFCFISGYAGLFVLMGILLIPQGRAMAISAAVLGVLSAIFDVIENLGILRIVNADLAHTTQPMIDAVRYPSLTKWTLASIGVGMLAIQLIRVRRAGPRIVGAFYLIAALLGLYGVYDNAVLQWSGIPTLAGLIGLAVLYFRPYRRKAG
jgi:hypothetical protein